MTYETMRTFFALLTVVANVAVVGAILLAVLGRWSRGVASIRHRVASAVAGYEIALAFFVALTATLGSLYLSEVVHLIPCTYCWYQRIAMYPLVLLFALAWIRRDDGIRHYTIPMAGIGLFIGCGLALPVVAWFTANPIPIGGTEMEEMAAMVGMEPVVRFDLLPSTIPLAALTIFAVAALAALYPAVKASRARPVDALRSL